MVDLCELCQKPIDLDANDGFNQHNICVEVGRERKNSKICTRCGAKPVDEKSFFHCADCNFKSPYKMYPGPDS